MLQIVFSVLSVFLFVNCSEELSTSSLPGDTALKGTEVTQQIVPTPVELNYAAEVVFTVGEGDATIADLGINKRFKPLAKIYFCIDRQNRPAIGKLKFKYEEMGLPARLYKLSDQIPIESEEINYEMQGKLTPLTMDINSDEVRPSEFNFTSRSKQTDVPRLWEYSLIPRVNLLSHDVAVYKAADGKTYSIQKSFRRSAIDAKGRVVQYSQDCEAKAESVFIQRLEPVEEVAETVQ